MLPRAFRVPCGYRSPEPRAPLLIPANPVSAFLRLVLTPPLQALDENLRHPQPYIQSGAVAAVRAYARWGGGRGGAEGQRCHVSLKLLVDASSGH